MEKAEAAILFVVAFAFIEVLRFVISRFLAKTVDAKYITEEHCRNCNGSARRAENELRDMLSELRGITLLIAMKVGIDNDDIRKLVR